MNAELSQRVGQVSMMPAINNLPNGGLDFLDAVTRAKDFNHLAPQWQKVILEAEEQALEWWPKKENP